MPKNVQLRKPARDRRRGKAKPSRRLNFQNESWYAEAAQKISAVRPTAQALRETPSPPLATD
jgi:hypothetical protein